MGKNNQRWHINKQGIPAVCQAKKQLCPLGGDNSHYDNKEQAQKAADEINFKKYGVNGIPTEKTNEEKTKNLPKNKNKIPVDNKDRPGYTEPTYQDKVESVKKGPELLNEDASGFHYSQERAPRIHAYDEAFGEGKPVATFLVKERGRQEVIHQVFDNGRTKILAVNDPNKVITEYVPAKVRLEYYFKEANITPPDGLLETVRINHKKADKLESKIKKEMNEIRKAGMKNRPKINHKKKVDE